MQTVVGVFDSLADAESAREELVRAGFLESSISVQSHAEDADEGFMASVSHFFRDLFGGDNDKTGNYSEAVRRGGSVVAINVEDDESKVAQARAALASAGAVNIEKRADAWREEGYSSFDSSARPYRSDEVEAERNRVMPVVREELEVGKREVDLGAVHVFTRTESRPVNETVELREQHADINRRPVDRPATEADLRAFESGGSVEVHEMAERPVVNKTARVVEEVTVGTQASTRTENISDTVRNTVVEVEKGDRVLDDGMQQDRLAGFRTHFDRNFASSGGRYEDYEPAYLYGSSLSTDKRYANQSWDDIEPDLQQDWSRRNPGTTWERVKAAVRHGWEPMTGERTTAPTTTATTSKTGSRTTQSTGRRVPR